MRWKKNGDPSLGALNAQSTCEAGQCGNRTVGQGLCNMHYKRAKRAANPRARKYRQRGDSYASAHNKVKRLHGPARIHECEKCGEPALDWAYDHGDPNELYDSRGCPYSLNPERYMPLCRQCHCIFDQIGVKR